jgi:hypothetical protein
MAGSGGGADTAGPQSALNQVCVTVRISPCPQLPTVNQLIVENAALTGTTPDAVRANQNLPLEAAVDAGSLTGQLTNPLAFISPFNNQGQPIPTNPTDPAANSFLTATTTPTNGNPSTLDLTFDYHLRAQGFTGQQGLPVGEIILPLSTNQMPVSDLNPTLATLSNPPLATLQIFADPNTCPTCVTTDIVASLTGAPVTYQLSQLGMTFSNDNSKPGDSNFSPNEQFTVGVPLLVPAGFVHPRGYTFSASGHEFANGLFDGIDPVANFLMASFMNDNNEQLAPAFNADLAIVKNGSTIISDPVPMPEPSTLVLLGSGILGLALLRRRRRAQTIAPDV